MILKVKTENLVKFNMSGDNSLIDTIYIYNSTLLLFDDLRYYDYEYFDDIGTPIFRQLFHYFFLHL